MNPKPSDLMLNVIEFFGVLIPGAILFFLHGGWFLSSFGYSMSKPPDTKYWVLAFFVSIILGHLLLGVSEPLDKLAATLSMRLFKEKDKWPWYPKWPGYLKAAKASHLKLPPEVPADPKNCFYWVFSFLRIHNAVAVAELERLAADQKLFRSLTLLFLLDIMSENDN
jgi:hypothetical protein